MKRKFGGQLIKPAVRRLHALHDVAFDSAWFEEVVDRHAYDMYGDLARRLPTGRPSPAINSVAITVIPRPRWGSSVTTCRPITRRAL